MRALYELAQGAASWTAGPALPAGAYITQLTTRSDGTIFATGEFSPLDAPAYTAVYEGPGGAMNWSAGPSLPATDLDPQVRAGTDGAIYALGGTNCCGFPINAVYELAKGATAWSAGPPLPVATGDLIATTGADGTVYAIGGTMAYGKETTAVYELHPVSSGAAASPSTTASCQFILGFATLASLIPQQVGQCRDDEGHNPANGDALQHTTGGLLVWRKLDNWTAFTDGYHSWINGPNGLQERLNTQRFPWEANPTNLPVVR